MSDKTLLFLHELLLFLESTCKQLRNVAIEYFLHRWVMYVLNRLNTYSPPEENKMSKQVVNLMRQEIADSEMSSIISIEDNECQRII